MITLVTHQAMMGAFQKGEGDLFEYGGSYDAKKGPEIYAFSTLYPLEFARASVATVNDLPLIATITEFLAERDGEPWNIDKQKVFFHVAADLVTAKRLDMHGLNKVGLPALVDIFSRWAERNNVTSIWHPLGERMVILMLHTWNMVPLQFSVPPGEAKQAEWTLGTGRSILASGQLANGDHIFPLFQALSQSTGRGPDGNRWQVTYREQMNVVRNHVAEIDALVPKTPMNASGLREMKSLRAGPP